MVYLELMRIFRNLFSFIYFIFSFGSGIITGDGYCSALATPELERIEAGISIDQRDYIDTKHHVFFSSLLERGHFTTERFIAVTSLYNQQLNASHKTMDNSCLS